MELSQKELLAFLEEQVRWCRQQDEVLQEMECKLEEMRTIAKYALEHKLSPIEIDEMNRQLYGLRQEVNVLSSQLKTQAH